MILSLLFIISIQYTKAHLQLRPPHGDPGPTEEHISGHLKGQ